MPKYLVLVLIVLLFLGGCRQNDTPLASVPVAEPPQTQPEVEPETPSIPEPASAPDTIDPIEEADRVSAAPDAQDEPSSEPEPVSMPAEIRPQPSSAVEEAPPSPKPAERTERASAEAASSTASMPETDTPSPFAFGAQDAVAMQSASASSLESALLGLINEARTGQGLSALGVEESMQFAAAIRAQEVLDSLSHTRPDSTPYHTAFDEAGFVYAGKWHGENLAYLLIPTGSLDDRSIAQALFDEWSKSPGHEQNMLSENFLQTGIGVFVDVDGDTTRIGSAQLFAGL